MLVKPPHCRIAEEDAPAAVGLQPMLVRIDHNGINPAHSPVSLLGRPVKIVGDQAKVSAVGRIHMHPEPVSLFER